jgi:hypothetical protein
MLSQILNERHLPLECFDVFAHGTLLPPEPSVGERRRQSQARMVGGRIFSKTQGTENFQSGSYPRQRPGFVKNLMPVSQPMSYAGDGPVEKGKRRLRKVQAAQPAPNCRGIRQPIRVFQIGRCLLPRTVPRNAPQQRLATREQTEMRVRKREQRKEGKGNPAIGAAAATNPNPVVMLVVCLLAAPSVTNDRIPFTKRTSA